MEEWDIYDKHRIKTGKTVIRGTSLSKGEYHLVIHVCLINPANKMLIQQRQPFKKGWPNQWDLTVGGSACTGENSQVAAERELFEEIGFQVDLSNVRPHFTVNFKRGFDDFYIIEAEPDLSQLKLQDSEVQGIQWASKTEIIGLINSKEFIPYHHSIIDMIFDMKQQLGVHQF